MNLTVFALVWIGLLLAIPIWIGIYVYRDARDREMNAPLWTLAAVLLPAFVGLILYLLCRSDHPNLHCPQCGGPVRESFALCPRCGAALKNRCVRCGFPLEAGWTVCPGCGEPIREDAAAYTPPVARRDRGLKWLIAAAIALPLLLVLLALLSFTTFSHSGSTSTGGISSVSLEEVDPDSALGAWTGGLQGQEGIFVLSSTEETGDGQTSASYWIYLGGVEALQSFTQFQEGGPGVRQPLSPGLPDLGPVYRRRSPGPPAHHPGRGIPALRPDRGGGAPLPGNPAADLLTPGAAARQGFAGHPIGCAVPLFPPVGSPSTR